MKLNVKSPKTNKPMKNGRFIYSTMDNEAGNDHSMNELPEEMEAWFIIIMALIFLTFSVIAIYINL